MNIHAEQSRFDHFNDLRIQFLERIAKTHLPLETGASRPSLVVVTHLLPDRPALLTVLGQYFEVEHVFGIPYSTNQGVAAWVANHFPLSEPTLSQLIEGSCIEQQLVSSTRERIVLLDIGGYAASLVDRTREKLGERFCGVVEGTSSGFRRYSATEPHNLPIVCMSLSPIKTAESALVGSACLFSTERILRDLGFANELKTVAVLGYGAVGKSVAEACRARGLVVYVFDQEPERSIQALADGFLIPNRLKALAEADLVLAATGQRSWWAEDAQIMRDGAFLVSCSSKDVEFDFAGIRQNYPVEELGRWVHAVTIYDKRLHFAYEGRPVNFSDGANLGPLLTLLQAEMITVCGDLLYRRFAPGIQGPNRDTRGSVIKEWFDHYLDMDVGWYRRRTVP